MLTESLPKPRHPLQAVSFPSEGHLDRLPKLQSHTVSLIPVTLSLWPKSSAPCAAKLPSQDPGPCAWEHGSFAPPRPWASGEGVWGLENFGLERIEVKGVYCRIQLESLEVRVQGALLSQLVSIGVLV